LHLFGPLGLCIQWDLSVPLHLTHLSHLMHQFVPWDPLRLFVLLHLLRL
jgi:hypothetical protein